MRSKIRGMSESHDKHINIDQRDVYYGYNTTVRMEDAGTDRAGTEQAGGDGTVGL